MTFLFIHLSRQKKTYFLCLIPVHRRERISCKYLEYSTTSDKLSVLEKCIRARTMALFRSHLSHVKLQLHCSVCIKHRKQEHKRTLVVLLVIYNKYLQLYKLFFFFCTVFVPFWPLCIHTPVNWLLPRCLFFVYMHLRECRVPYRGDFGCSTWKRHAASWSAARRGKEVVKRWKSKTTVRSRWYSNYSDSNTKCYMFLFRES